MACKFELQRTKDSRYVFVLIGEDGVELLRGLPHYSKMHARRDAELVSGCINDPSKVFRLASHNELYFTLHNAKDEMFARSLHVHSQLALDEIIDETREASSKAVILDATERHVKRATAH